MGGEGGSTTTTTAHTWYYYRIKFAHNSIDPSKEIILYNAYGEVAQTVPPYYAGMDYGTGILTVPGSNRNTEVENIATATYHVFYSSSDLIIDYEKAEFFIAKRLIKVPAQTLVRATFEYISVITPFKDIASVIDGRWDTQVQTQFFSEPPTGYNYAILDLGSVQTIQAIDIVAGFFKPDSIRRYDIDFHLTLQYSNDNVNYYEIGDKTHIFQMTGGSSVSFDEEDLGVGFQARYLKMLIENIKKVDYGQVKDQNGTILREGVYVIALTEIAAYGDIILTGESSLISTTELTSDITLPEDSGSYPTTIAVKSTSGFTDPSSNTSSTAYILNSDETYDVFTYTGLTSTSFTGVQGLSQNHTTGDNLVQSIEGDNTYYDYNYLLPKLKDRIYKVNKVDNSILYSQSQLDYVAKAYLKEFVKNHSKINVEVLYSPHIEVGKTIKIIDTFNNINRNYFVESINDNNGFYTLVCSYYP